MAMPFQTLSCFFLPLSTSIVPAECTRDNEAATQFRDVWTPHCFPHRFHRGGAITTRTLNGFGRPVPAPGGGGRTTWHTRRRISSRKVQRGVSNVITLDSCLLCSSTTKSYSALTSKAKLPSGPPVPSFSSDSPPPSPRARAHPFSPFLRCNDVRTKDVNKSRRKRGWQWKTSDGKRRRGRRRAKTKIK